jgi:hypothetical protein
MPSQVRPAPCSASAFLPCFNPTPVLLPVAGPENLAFKFGNDKKDAAALLEKAEAAAPGAASVMVEPGSEAPAGDESHEEQEVISSPRAPAARNNLVRTSGGIDSGANEEVCALMRCGLGIGCFNHVSHAVCR